jgi:hypothetical protein
VSALAALVLTGLLKRAATPACAASVTPSNSPRNAPPTRPPPSPSPHRPRTPSWIVLFLVVCTAFSACAAAVGVVTFHHEVEVAQGEASR